MAQSTETTRIVSSDHPDPLWLQVSALIAEDVARGRLPAGSRLSAERELCAQLGVSRVTLRKALTHLVDDGVLRPSHGRGWYVAAASERKDWPNRLESFSETAARMNLTPTSKVLRASVDPATLDEAEELGVAPGTPLFHLERIRLLEGIPTAIDRTRVPAHVAPALAETDFATGSLYAVLAEAGAEPAHAEATIEAQSSTPLTADALGIPEGQPVLRMRELAYDAASKPLFVSEIVYAGDRYRLRTSFTRSPD